MSAIRLPAGSQPDGPWAAEACMRAQVILLFQCIDGVDTCLYALYMQEYGDDCPAPNRKWIYLSYLDSIKYMRPDNVESARPGLALRTLVYHQIIISYLAYVKARGFTSMFIWACPPLQARPPALWTLGFP